MPAETVRVNARPTSEAYRGPRITEVTLARNAISFVLLFILLLRNSFTVAFRDLIDFSRDCGAIAVVAFAACRDFRDLIDFMAFIDFSRDCGAIAVKSFVAILAFWAFSSSMLWG